MRKTFHTYASLPIMTLALTFSQTGLAQGQSLAVLAQNMAQPGLVLSSFSPTASINLRNASQLTQSLERMLQSQLPKAELNNVMAVFRGADTGLKAGSYQELRAQMPTSAATILRLYGKFSASENISAAQLQNDILASIPGINPVSMRKSSQAAPAAATGAGLGAGAAAAIGLGVAALAISAGGGGSSGGTVNTTEGAFGIEYNAQYGLGTINAKANNDAGHTGAGVRVAVVDTGILAAHSEFSGRTINGTDFSGVGGFGSDANGHGTHVASTIGANRDELGMRGVAYDVDLFSYKIFGGTFSFSDAELAGLANQHVTDNIQVSNNSWGFSPSITVDSAQAGIIFASSPLTLTALAAAQANGTIFVWANGNSALSQPDFYAGLPFLAPTLAAQWLSVTATDNTNTEAAFTQRCGVAWDTCVTAPGVDIYAAWNTGTTDYNTISGTSMAAPHVSGLVALLIEEFPGLTPAQIVTRLKSTASYTGLTGRNGCTSATCTLQQMREIFGHGLVNQQAATATIGSLNYATSANIYSGPLVDISTSALKLPSGMGGAALASVQNATFTAFDSFDGAAFAVSGVDVFSSQSLNDVGSIGYVSMDAQNGATSERFRSLAMLSGGLGGMPTILMSQSAAPIDVASLSVWGDKTAFMPTPDFIKSESVNRVELIAGGANDSLKIIPYIQMNTSGSNEKTSGFGINFVFDLNADSRLVASLGRNDTAFDFDLFGGSSDQRASLDMLEIGFSQKIDAAWEVFGRVSQGYTSGFQASSTNWGLNNASFARATIGVEYKAKSGAQLAFGLVNSGNFTSGELSLVTATGRAQNGNITYSTQSFNAASAAQFVPFLATKIPVDLGLKSPGMVTFSVQQAPGSAIAISKADLSFSVSF